MHESQIKTLEDLRKYLEQKYEIEWKNLPLDEIIRRQDAVLNQYQLTSDEYDYAAPITAVMEEQSANRTMINTKKAQEILLKRK